MSTKAAESPKSAAPPTEAPKAPVKTSGSAPAAQTDAAKRFAAGWRAIDRIVMVVNEDMLTSQGLQKDLNRWRKLKSITKKDEPTVLMDIQRARVRTMLEVQGGQDMGLDVALVKRQVLDNVERLSERFNGISGLADFLKSRDMDSTELREQLKNEIYADIWEKHITGEAAVPGERISVDRYVRPGMLQLYYENGVQHPENLEQIGGKPQQVVLQHLFIDEQQQGGEANAKNLLKTLRQRILDGEDMGDICEHHSAAHSAKKDRGLVPASPEANFAQLDPAIGTFLSTAKPGDISDLLPYKTEDGARFWRIVKLVERIPPVLPELASSEIQQKLTERIQFDYSELRKAVALDRLFRASYVWPTELGQH